MSFSPTLSCYSVPQLNHFRFSALPACFTSLWVPVPVFWLKCFPFTFLTFSLFSPTSSRLSDGRLWPAKHTEHRGEGQTLAGEMHSCTIVQVHLFASCTHSPADIRAVVMMAWECVLWYANYLEIIEILCAAIGTPSSHYLLFPPSNKTHPLNLCLKQTLCPLSLFILL